MIRLELLLQARGLLRKVGQEVPIELLNNIGVLHFERGEFEVCAILRGLEIYKWFCGRISIQLV